MSSIKEIKYEHIKEFLRKNDLKVPFNDDEGYKLAYNLIKKGKDYKATDEIYYWITAHNLIKKNTTLPKYKKSEILEFSDDQLSILSKSLGLGNNNIDDIFGIMKYLNKIELEDVYSPIKYNIVTRFYGKDFSQALKDLGFGYVLDINAFILNNGFYPDVSSIFVGKGGSYIYEDKKYGEIGVSNGSLTSIEKFGGIDNMRKGEEYYEFVFKKDFPQAYDYD